MSYCNSEFYFQNTEEWPASTSNVAPTFLSEYDFWIILTQAWLEPVTTSEIALEPASNILNA